MDEQNTITNTDGDEFLNGPDGENFLKMIFSTKGRINNRTYAFYTLLLNGLYFVTLSIISNLFTLKDDLVLYLVLLLPFIIMIFIIGSKRFHDLGRKGSNIFLTLIPIYNIVVEITLFFEKGNKESNNYGDRPKDSSKKTKIITIVLLILFIITNFI